MTKRILPGLAFAILALPCQAADDDRLVGLWASRTEIPPAYRGEVTLREDARGHEVCAGGRCARWSRDAAPPGSLRFELPGVGEVVME